MRKLLYGIERFDYDQNAYDYINKMKNQQK